MTGDGGHTAADDVVIGRVLTALLARAHLMRPDDLTSVLAEEARALGIERVRLYLADLQQRYLHPVPDDEYGSGRALAIESTMAGRAFQTVTIHQADGEGGDGAGGTALSHRLWVPLMDGTERLGVGADRSTA